MKISNAKYAALLYQITQGHDQQEIQGLVRKFLNFVATNRGLSRLAKIIELYKILYNKKEGVTDVEIVSANALASETTALILQNISNAGLNAPQVLECQEYSDPKMISGLSIKVGDDRIDGTLNGRVEQLRQKFFS